MKSLNIDGIVYQIVDEFARKNIDNLTGRADDIDGEIGNIKSALQQEALFDAIFDLVHPIGKHIITSRAENPAEYLGGGVWEPVKDVFLLAAGDNYSFGDTGGEAEHTLRATELPVHSHHAYNFSDGNNDWSFLTVKRATSTRRQIATSTSSKIYAMTSDADVDFRESLDWPYTTSMDGGGNQAHNNMPPYKVVYVWERVA